jgi:hypothetical protein
MFRCQKIKVLTLRNSFFATDSQILKRLKISIRISIVLKIYTLEIKFKSVNQWLNQKKNPAIKLDFLLYISCTFSFSIPVRLRYQDIRQMSCICR